MGGGGGGGGSLRDTRKKEYALKEEKGQETPEGGVFFITYYNRLGDRAS